MIKKHLKGIPLLVCGVLLFTACSGDSGNDNPDPGTEPSLTDDNAPGITTGSALASRTRGGWEKGGVDALSSASILRVDRNKFGYIDKSSDGYLIKIVDVNDPTKAVREKLVAGNGDNTALWTTGHNGNIIIAAAEETGYEAFTGHNIVVYDTDLKVIKKAPFGNPTGLTPGEAVPIHHRDPNLAVTEKYAIAGWQDKQAEGNFSSWPFYISIYSLTSEKAGHILVSKSDDPGLGIGNLVAFVAQGDYIIISGSTGTKVYRINDSGESILLEAVPSALTPGGHWMLDNRKYVMESTSGNGQVRIWKWNGSRAPTVVGSANVGAASGNVQAMSFDNENPDKAYIFGRVAAGDTPNAGEVYSVNLSTAQATKLFKIPSYEGGGALSGIWTIQVESHGSDAYYILGGTVAGTTGDTTKPNRNGVLVIKNPRVDGSDIDDTFVDPTTTLLDFPTAVRTMKAFKNSANDIVYAAKNYTSGGANFNSTDYKLRVIEVNDD